MFTFAKSSLVDIPVSAISVRLLRVNWIVAGD